MRVAHTGARAWADFPRVNGLDPSCAYNLTESLQSLSMVSFIETMTRKIIRGGRIS